MGVAQGVPFLVAHGFEELVDPYWGSDGETFTVEGREGGWSSAWLENGPEAVDTHFENLRRSVFECVEEGGR